jgi:hypothetical protein
MAKQDLPIVPPVQEYLNNKKQFDMVEKVERLIESKFRLVAKDQGEINTTMWGDAVRRALRAVVELIDLADRAGVERSKLRLMKSYTALTADLRQLVENIMMVRLGEDYGFAFALERGFEDLLKHECKVLDDEGVVKVRVRFVKPRNREQIGKYPIYERMTFRFNGQFEVGVIDAARYGM